MTVPGKVFLVGAGPGDPGLITVRGLSCLKQADLVLYDGLVNPLLLQLTSARVERTSRTKTAAREVGGQDQINRRLIEEARAGKVVVRLKGGARLFSGGEARRRRRSGRRYRFRSRAGCDGGRRRRGIRGPFLHASRLRLGGGFRHGA